MKRAVCLLLASIAWAADGSTPGITGDQVVSHLNSTIAWYQHVSALDQNGGATANVLLANNVHQAAKEVVRKAFAFARAQALLLANQKLAANPALDATSQPHTLDQTAALAAQRIQNLQKRLDELNQQLTKASKKTIATLTAERDMLDADLTFAKTAQTSIKDMLQFASGSEKGSGLIGQINLLAQSDSMPAALSDLTPATAVATGATTATATAAAAAAGNSHPESSGIAALLADVFRLLRERSQVDSLLKESSALNVEIGQLRAPVRTEIRELLNQSDALANAALDQTSAAALDAQRQQIERMTTRFKALAGPIVTLTEQGLALATTQGGLTQWRENMGDRLQTLLGYLALRLCTLAAGVIVLFVLSEVVRRATLRYVRDSRRRQQFVLIRRFVVGLVAAILVIFASLSGIGSFATMAGFVTAGLAVALQNVILSVVAYFFLIGRYGLRTGDRVTVSGLTGDVIEVGLVRLYLMEFAGTGSDIHSTGRVAVFSNSVIFQPSALIKQAPGTEYVWHGVSVTFAEGTDIDLGRERMLKAVTSVYQTYKTAIDLQHAAFERAVSAPLPDANPISRARYTDSGVEVIVRYPVEIHQVSLVDEKVTNAVMQEVQKDPELKLVPSGYPRTLGSTS